MIPEIGYGGRGSITEEKQLALGINVQSPAPPAVAAVSHVAVLASAAVSSHGDKGSPLGLSPNLPANNLGKL